MQIQNVSRVGIAARMSLRVGRLLAPAVMATLLSLGQGVRLTQKKCKSIPN